MSKREAVSPAARHALYDAHRYSAAIRSGDLLFVSGQVGSREDGSPEPTFEAQVRRAFANLRTVLAAAGCTFDDGRGRHHLPHRPGSAVCDDHGGARC